MDFNYDEFYRAIVNHFEVTPGPISKARVEELLAWWNRSVFSVSCIGGPDLTNLFIQSYIWSYEWDFIYYMSSSEFICGEASYAACGS